MWHNLHGGNVTANLVRDEVSAMVDRVDQLSSKISDGLLALPVDQSCEHDARLALLRGG